MRLIVATGRIETVPLPQPVGKSLPSRGAHRVREVLLPGWIGKVDSDEFPDRVLGAFEQEPPNLLVGDAVFAPMLGKAKCPALRADGACGRSEKADSRVPDNRSTGRPESRAGKRMRRGLSEQLPGASHSGRFPRSRASCRNLLPRPRKGPAGIDVLSLRLGEAGRLRTTSLTRCLCRHPPQRIEQLKNARADYAKQPSPTSPNPGSSALSQAQRPSFPRSFGGDVHSKFRPNGEESQEWFAYYQVRDGKMALRYNPLLEASARVIAYRRPDWIVPVCCPHGGSGQHMVYKNSDIRVWTP